MDEADGTFFKAIHDIMVKGDYPTSNISDITNMANSIVSGVHDELFGKVIKDLQSEEYKGTFLLMFNVPF